MNSLSDVAERRWFRWFNRFIIRRLGGFLLTWRQKKGGVLYEPRPE